jgi:hypothetical protein
MNDIVEQRRDKRRKKTAEVFTPPFLVNEILDEFSPKMWEEGRTFIDPACGNGNFLVEVLQRKLKLGHNPLEALKTIYGVDIMRDNIRECRLRLLKVVSLFTPITLEHIAVAFQNIVFLNKVKYPTGSLEYDFSFSKGAKMEDVQEWMDKIGKGELDSIDLPVSEDNFLEKGVDLFHMFDQDEDEHK